MSGTIIHIKLNAAKAKIRIEGNDSHNNPPKKIFHEEAAVTFSSFRDLQKIEILDANYLFRIACTLVRRNARERCLLIHSATNYSCFSNPFFLATCSQMNQKRSTKPT